MLKKRVSFKVKCGTHHFSSKNLKKVAIPQLLSIRSMGSVNINLFCMHFLCYKTSCSACGVMKENKAYAFSFPLVNPPKAADLKLSHLPEDLMEALMSS